MGDRIRTLLFSTLFPSGARPNHGIFVETRLRHLLASGRVETRVIAPVPWFPFRQPIFGEYALHAAVARQEVRHGIPVEHPRYLLLPKVGMNLAPDALARAGLDAARRLIADGYDFDVIDAHYFYPDGVAAAMIGRALGKPVVITARGSDVNLIGEFPRPRQRMVEAATDAAAVVAVSDALRERLVAMGVDRSRISVLRNGVDLERFQPRDRASARQALGLDRYTIASVGNLVPLKGHDIAIRALAELPDAELVIAGTGPQATILARLAEELHVADRVRFLGLVSQDYLCSLYSAADCLVLASEREGCPNVLLEAMACGTPVVATAAGGIPELVSVPEAGVLMSERSVAGLVDALLRLRQAPPAREATRRHARSFDWAATTAGQIALFEPLGQCSSAAATAQPPLRAKEST